MQLLGLVIISAITILLGGCLAPGGAKPPSGFIEPPYESEFTRIDRSLTECRSPLKREAKKNLTPKFKYGCFCGANHPIPESLGKELEPHEQVEKLLEIRPLDEIDAACQMHDICWALNGKEVWCDDAFSNQLEVYLQEIKPLIGFWEVETEEWRCSNLARDIKMAGRSTFPSFSKDRLWGTTMVGFKVVTAPLALLYAALTAATWDNYPSFSCNIDDLRKKNTEYPIRQAPKD